PCLQIFRMANPQKNNIIKLSLVIPCFNEANRVDILVDGLREFIDEWEKDYEVIIVDDGSTDETVQGIKDSSLFKKLSRENKMTVLQLGQNQGKGAALREGVLNANGTHILTLDSDMACHPLQVKKWMEKQKTKLRDNRILIGCRPHKKSNITDKPLRKFVGIIFNLIIRLLTPLRITDTQCGFKLYPLEIGKYLFSELKVKGWSHDVEVLYKAFLKEISIKEMPVVWNAVDNSKVSVGTDSVKMFLQVLYISLFMKWEWYVTEPLKKTFRNVKGPYDLPESLKAEKDPPIFRLLFFLTIFILFFSMPMLSFDFGITGDEWHHYRYGKQVYDYFLKGDTSALTSETGIHFYGGLFDFTVAATNKFFKITSMRAEYETSHFINSLFGFAAILFTGLLAVELVGWRMGFLALIFLVLSPRFFGHAMNNPKDIPFAAAYIFTIYHTIKFLKHLPRPSIRSVIYIIMGIACALNVRIGGLLLIAYFGLFTLIEICTNKKIHKYIKKQKILGPLNLIKYMLIITVLGYFAGLIFWPYGHSDPIHNPLIALQTFSKFFTSMQILFDDQHINAKEVPWHYIPKWMSITVPIIVMAGFFLFFILYIFIRKLIRPSFIFILLFAIFFPLAYAIYQKSVLYDGWRHFIFIYPPIIILSTITWNHFLTIAKHKIAKWIVVIIIVLLFFSPAKWMIKNHPYEYVYFNEVIGGIDNAFGKFETDYWMNGVKETFDWFIEQDEIKNSKKQIVLLTNCHRPLEAYVNSCDIDIKLPYARFYDRNTKDWDYAIFYSRFADKDQLQKNAWPPKGVIYTAKADNTPLVVLIKRENKSAFYGNQEFKKRNYRKAIEYLQDAIKYDPNHEGAFYDLGLSYLQLNQNEKAVPYLQRAISIHPDNTSALYSIGYAYLKLNRLNEAIGSYKKAIEITPYYPDLHNYLGMAYLRTGDQDRAIQCFKNTLKMNSRHQRALQNLVLAYKQKGDNATANQYMEALKKLQGG
ncbi:glycosyltransferase, partial [Bacteroidales bacterium AH-315-N07]|nr:glycosyltransferase [Bacteroidales bacterium AH-315-N07]